MKNTILLLTLLLSVFGSNAQHIHSKARWITVSQPDSIINKPNRWIAFRKDFQLKEVPGEAIAQIAVDSKYWLWINGKQVIFEGGLKRGPNPSDTYFDEVDLSPFLQQGKNQIAILLWYFGKEGFSHKDSGKAGLIFNLSGKKLQLHSDKTWLAGIHPAYQNTEAPYPNYRLPESNIRFDARLEPVNWQTEDCQSSYGFTPAKEIGNRGESPWNKLVKRPIPMWKDFGIKPAIDIQRKRGPESDTIMATLPYNMQMTPVIDVTDPKGGNLISIITDHLTGGSDMNLRAEYITKKGRQVYESFGWLNGQQLILTIPSDITINEISYRETGYATEPSRFFCDNEFYMRFWKKALRTLYVNTRDTYFDCPDRERAQWWGDVVVLMSQSFYSYSTEIHALSKKAMYELIGWQKEDGSLFSPVPAGNYNSELPGQMLASIGYYGFWNYYMNTGDKKTIQDLYPGVKKYLSLWQSDETGLTAFRQGGWTWGDWGDNRDMRLIFAGWHYLALKGASEMATLLGYTNDAQAYGAMMEKVKDGYNRCWNGFAYRHPQYHGETDDRVQALAVISGIADPSKYEKITDVFKTQFHASPYMEKYVMEALFIMEQGEYALQRTEKRFSKMVNHPKYTTLFEGWDVGGFGGGTVNHAWSGGALTVIGQYLCGIYPLEAGYSTFKIEPNPASFQTALIEVPSIAGTIQSEFISTEEEFTLNVLVPSGTRAVIYLPNRKNNTILINNLPVPKERFNPEEKYQHPTKATFQLPEGSYTIVMKQKPKSEKR